MSTQPPPAPAPAPPPPAAPAPPTHITIYSHSFMFYWWPVWAAGFILAAISHWSGHVLAIVPDGTRPHVSTLKKDEVKKEDKDGKKVPGKFVDATVTLNTETSTKTEDFTGRSILVLPEKADVSEERASPKSIEPRLHIANSKNHGVFFFSIALFVIFVTTVPLRGLLSILVIMFVASLIIIFALAGIWDKILTQFSFIDIRINQGGYLFFSTVLFIMWLLVFLLYDKQIYVIFQSGLVVVKLTIGEGETAFDTQGMVVQKLRSNFFLHWILGLGTSDLVIRFGGAAPQHFDLPNVFVGGHRLAQIESLTKSKAVVAGRPH